MDNINKSMKGTSHTSPNPFKIIKMINGDDIICKITEEYKESDSTVVQVVETIPISSILGTDTTYVYTYLSQKPYKTLPSDEIIRVYDKVPVKALGQEVTSNRVVYSNFQNKHTPPNFINYQVGVSQKIQPGTTGSSKSTVEYPNHSLKENRNYQVGVVLSDKFGRQSTVILSNNIEDSTLGVGADTVYLPYNSINNSISFLGSSIKTQFNTILSGVGIDKDETTGTPGLYNNDATSPDYNPLGWYSYKIVVKQIEQEYYNVYTSGAIKGNIEYTGAVDSDNPPNQNVSSIVLINDNINKVPRDLSEVGPQDIAFRSSVILFGRVENTQQQFSYIGNKQYFPGRRSFTTSTVENLFDIFDVADAVSNQPITNSSNPYYTFYRSESDPFVGQFVTSQTPSDQFGVVNTKVNNNYIKTENLTILETKPTISRLDIYWETSTSGLLSELNIAIGGNTQAGQISSDWNYVLSEASNPGDNITGDFKFQSILGTDLTNINSVTMSVTDNSGADRTSEFALVANTSPADTYKVLTASSEYFYYEQSSNLNIFNFVFGVQLSAGGTINSISKPNQALINITPTISNNNAGIISLFEGTRDIPLLNGNPTGKATGVNGSNPSGGRSTEGLIFSISEQSGSGDFEIDTTDGISVINTDGTAVGNGSFKLKLEDGGSPVNLSTTKLFNVNFQALNPICVIYKLDASSATVDTTYQYVSCSGTLQSTTVTVGNDTDVCARIGSVSITAGNGIISTDDFVCSGP